LRAAAKELLLLPSYAAAVVGPVTGHAARFERRWGRLLTGWCGTEGTGWFANDE